MSLSRNITNAIEAMLTAIEPGSCSAKAEGRAYAHDHSQRALKEKLDWLAKMNLYLLSLLSRREGGYLVLDDMIIERSGPGKLKLPKLRNSKGHYCLGLGVVLLVWSNGSVRIPLNLRLRFGIENKQDLALELLAWAYESGLKLDCVPSAHLWSCQAAFAPPRQNIHGCVIPVNQLGCQPSSRG